MAKFKGFGLDRFSGVYLWVIFIVVFSVLSPEIFPTMSTVHLIASTQAVSAIVALALLVPFVSGQFDLSVGATANLAGLIAATTQTRMGVSPFAAVGLALLVGVGVGLLNSFIIVRLRVDSFIATLGSSAIIAAFQIMVTDNAEPQPVVNSTWDAITQTSVFGFQLVVVFMLVAAVAVWWFLEKTPGGRFMRASGSNPEAARLAGVKVNRWATTSLLISGVLSALAGTLFVSLAGPSLTFGTSLLLPAFAAVFLGTTQLVPGRANVWGTLLAIFVLATGVQGLQLVTGVQWVAQMFNGVALILAVALAVGRAQRRPRGRRRGSPPADPVAEEALPAAPAPAVT
jgi:ribose transport system permease protein